MMMVFKNNGCSILCQLLSPQRANNEIFKWHVLKVIIVLITIVRDYTISVSHVEVTTVIYYVARFYFCQIIII